jgi:hypothetical protein
VHTFQSVILTPLMLVVGSGRRVPHLTMLLASDVQGNLEIHCLDVVEIGLAAQDRWEYEVVDLVGLDVQAA